LKSVFGAAAAPDTMPKANVVPIAVIANNLEKVCIEIPLFAALQKRDRQKPSRRQSLG
jgi:hypothetical protein